MIQENALLKAKADIMPVHVFKEDISQANLDILQKTINRTGGHADRFYNDSFRRWMKHEGTQSESIAEIFENLIREVEELK